MKLKKVLKFALLYKRPLKKVPVFVVKRNHKPMLNDMNL